MFNEPLISVIIPVYKVEKYLTKCVDSVTNQTYKNIQIILVDDGSPDNCPAICDKLADSDDRIIVIHKENGGLSDARNAGLKIAKGQYVTFVDSDDYIDSDFLKVLFNRLLNDGSDLAVCNYMYVDECYNPDRFEKENSVEIIDGVLSGNEAQSLICGDIHWHYSLACCKLYKRTLFEDIKFPVGKLHEDLFIMYLIYDKCEKISFVNSQLYYYLQNTSSITHTFTLQRLDAFEAYYNRFNFYIDKNMIYCAEQTALFMTNILFHCSKSLDLSESKNKAVIVQCKKKYNSSYKLLLKHHCINKQMIKLTLFYLGFTPFDLYIKTSNFVKRLLGR